MKTGSERFACLARGEPPDRVPVVCNLLDQGARELGMSIEEYYSSGKHVAEGQLRLREKYGYDALWGFSYMAYIPELLGCRNLVWAENGPPNVGHMVLNKPGDIETFEIPDDITSLPRFRDVAECIGILKKELGGKYPVISPVISSFTLPSVLIGMDKWLEMLHLGPVPRRDQLLEKCSDFCIRHTRALREAGVDLIPYTNPLGSADFIDGEFFRETALPWIKKDIEGMGTDGIVYFGGGARLNPNIDSLIRHTGISVYYTNPMDDPAEAKAIAAGRAAVTGIINDIKLMSWEDEEIDREVERIMKAGAPGGGFVFGTLVMPYLLPEQKITRMLQAAYKYGKYGD